MIDKIKSNKPDFQVLAFFQTEVDRRSTAIAISNRQRTSSGKRAVSLVAASSQGSETWLFALTCFCYGIGRGTVTAPLYNTVLSGVSPKDAGAASGIASTAQQVANSIGIAMIGLLVFSTLPKHPTTADLLGDLRTRCFFLALDSTK